MAWHDIANLTGPAGDGAAMEILARVPQRRGALPDGADLNDYYLPEHYGVWQYGASPTYLNGPKVTSGGILEIIPGGGSAYVLQRLTTSDGMLWREVWEASNGTWPDWVIVPDALDVSMPIEQKMLFDLAKSDGWHALYDPANPKGRVLDDGRIAELPDLLGNLPPAIQEVRSARPRLNRNSFWGYGAATYTNGGVASALRTGVIDEPIEQPNFVMVMGRSNITSAGSAGRFVVDGASNDGRSAIFGSSTFTDRWATYAGAEFASSRKMDTNIHVFGSQSNGDFTVGGSQFFIDGVRQSGDSFSGSFNIRPLNGLTIGNHNGGGATRAWDGIIGPVLVYKGIPSDEVRQRMEQMLRAIRLGSTRIISSKLVSNSGIVMTEDGAVEAEKDPDYLAVPASLSKVVSMYVARQTITNARLDDPVTLTGTDALSGSAPQLQVGDVLSFRDLFYLAALPSHNVATEIIADRVGAELTGTGTNKQKFYALMNSTVQDWNWAGAYFGNASGLTSASRASARQFAELAFRVHREDPVLDGIMGTLTHTVNVTGTNPRSFTINHSIPVYGSPSFPEWVSGKSGTLYASGGNVAMLMNMGGVLKAVVTMEALPINARYPDARALLDGDVAAERTYSPKMTDTMNIFEQAYNNPGSRLKSLLDHQYLPGLDSELPVIFPGADLSASGAVFEVARAGAGVEMTVGAVRVPADASANGVVPAGMRPRRFAYGTVTVRDGGAAKVVEVMVSSTGRIAFYGNQPTDILRGTLSWLTDDV